MHVKKLIDLYMMKKGMQRYSGSIGGTILNHPVQGIYQVIPVPDQDGSSLQIKKANEGGGEGEGKSGKIEGEGGWWMACRGRQGRGGVPPSSSPILFQIGVPEGGPFFILKILSEVSKGMVDFT